ncbi:MAG: FAD binding domain-containing protein [Pseudomonadota bacterium]
MIPAPFEYHRPNSLDEAVALLARYGGDGRALAGGHSLIPMMKLRLAQPAHIIDLQGVDSLRGIGQRGDTVRIGAMVTQAELLASPLVAEKLPILCEAALQIADPQVRSFGTIGGNVANGDPGNDMPAVMMVLNAGYVVRGPRGENTVPAREFYKGIYTTAMQPNEILSEVRVPVPPAGHGHAYQKMKRKVGDYAIAAAAAIVTMERGRCTHAAIALTNVAPTPIHAAAAGKRLIGSSADAGAIGEAAELAAALAEPASDMCGPAEFRRHVAKVMARRAIEAARARVKGG